MKTKRKSKSIALFLMLAMILVGAGVTLAPKGMVSVEAAKSYAAEADFTLKTGSNQNYNNAWTYGVWSMFGAANNNAGWAFMKFGGKNTTISGNNPVYTRGQITGKAVGSVDVVFNASNLKVGSVNSWGLKAYSDSGYTTQIASVLGGAMTAETAQTLTLTPTASIPAGSYYEVYFDLANTTSTNGIVWVDKIQFVEASGGGDPEPEFGTLTSIAIKTPATKTTFVVGNVFSSAGLVLTASDDSEPVVTKTVSSGFTTNYDGVTFATSHLGSKTVTVYYSEGVQKTTTYNITVLAASSGFKLVSGTVLSVGATHTIATPTTTGDQYAISTYNSGGYFGHTAITKSNGTFSDNSNILKFVVENGYVLGTYAFKILNTTDAGKYITYTGSGNNLYATAKETIDASASWTIGSDGLIENAESTGRKIYNNAGAKRFAAYTNAQGAAGIFVDESTIIPEPEFVSTTRIELATDLAKKIFFVYETFTSAGLKVVAYDDVNEASKLVDTGFTTDFDGKVFTSADVGKGVSVTVTYDGIDETYPVDINDPRQFVKVTSTTQLQIGGSYIATGINKEEGLPDTLVALSKQEGTNRSIASIIKIGEDLYENDTVQILRLHEGHDSVADSFAFESVGGPKNGQFLAATGAGEQNYLQSEETITVKGSWVINVGASTTIEATGAGTTRNKMRYNDGNNIFSAYGSGQEPITLYVDESSFSGDTSYDDADGFSTWIMSQTGGDVVTAECASKYGTAKTKWAALSSDAQAEFKTHGDFLNARNRLERWAIANGETLEQFYSGISGGQQREFFDNKTTLSIVIVLSVLGITTIAGFYFLKRKEKVNIE